MYPARFSYEAPTSLDEALALLASGGPDAKVLAGGQSLVPLLKLRFASPALLVDINGLPGLGEHREGDPGQELDSVPIFQCSLVVVGSPRCRHQGSPAHWPWLVDPAGADQGTDTSRLLRRLGVPDSGIQVFPNQTAAWSAAASGAGVSVALAHLVAPQLRRHDLTIVPTNGTPMQARWHVTTLPTDRRSGAANSLRHFLGTPGAMHVMRAPGSGVPPSRFRPPVYVTIWS